MTKRWYDKDATVSLAVNMLKNANDDMRNSVCDLVQEKVKEMNIKPIEKFIGFKVFDKRWYDEKENLYNLMETIRCCSAEDKRKIATCIIDYLCDLT